MIATISKGLRDLGRNPIAIFIASIAISLAILLCSNLYIADQASPVAKALGGLATAILTGGTVGALFEYVNKGRLIQEAVLKATGQVNAVNLGVSDIKLKVSEIDYRKDIVNSKNLIVGSRYSSSFLDRHRDEIRERLLKKRRSLIVVHMMDTSIFPRTRDMDRTPEIFFREIKKFDSRICDKVTVLQTDYKMCYNFVCTDDGIWIKLYFNSPQQNLPPAIFIDSESPLHRSFMRDINLMIDNGKAVVW